MNHAAAAFLAEFEPECQTTRRFLERLPESRLLWRPHPASMTAGQLAHHIAEVPRSVLAMALQEECSPPDISAGRAQPRSCAEVLALLERSAAFVREFLPTLNDQRMTAELKIIVRGGPVFAMPRAVFLRSIMFNHWYHHRGQFGVYLRLVGARVPSSYGPSGDEAMPGVEREPAIQT